MKGYKDVVINQFWKCLKKYIMFNRLGCICDLELTRGERGVSIVGRLAVIYLLAALSVNLAFIRKFGFNQFLLIN
jgi:hypothetical protein